jgi:CDP-paratose 2-epimerase
VSGPTLITGGAGFIGTNTADRLLRDGRRVRIVDDLSRPGVERNLAWLEGQHGGMLEVAIGDVADADVMRRAVAGVDAVFHFAAQVAVTTSLVDPVRDADVNVRGTMQLLEAVRSRPRPPAVVFTSTNKVYGSLGDVELREQRERYMPVDRGLAAHGIGEDRPLAFCTPYGCSKGAADQYVLDYANSYGVPSVVFRMSCIYGPHQHGTEDQGWVAHFLISAIEGRPITIYGDGRQLRDVLYVDDLVDALLLARGRADELAGRAFNIGGGPANAISLLELVAAISDLRGEQPELHVQPWRPGDQRWYVSDTRRFAAATGWRPQVAPDQGVERLHAWLVEERASGERGAAREAVA